MIPFGVFKYLFRFWFCYRFLLFLDFVEFFGCFFLGGRGCWGEGEARGALLYYLLAKKDEKIPFDQ